MLASLLLAFGLVCPNALLGHVIERQIAEENDDVEEDLNPSKLGEIDAGSSDLELAYEDNGQGDPQLVGVRFTNIGIAPGTTITSAWVRFQVDETKSGTLPVNLIIEGELSANPAQFVGGGPGTFDISNRPRTATRIQWSVPNWENVGDSGAAQTTVDISPIIEELINQPDWAVGNAIVLIFSDDPDNPSEGIRAAEAGPGDDSALLHIEFGPATDEVWREAEYPDVMGANTAVASDAAASGLKYITDDGLGSNTGSTTLEWVNSYNFEAAGGDYKILARVIAPNGSDDSLWVRIPTATAQTAEHPDQAGSGWVRYNSIRSSETWVWDEVHSNDHDNATVIWTLPAGQNVLEIAIREDGTQLDGFVITNYLELDEDTLGSSIDPPPIAGAPVPENGAIEVVAAALSWTPPLVAATSSVYLSTDETIDAGDLIAETELSSVDVALEPGVSYWWRVDSVEADGIINTGEVWRFDTLAAEAHFPSPADGATLQAIDTQLSWAAGLDALVRDVYFSADLALVEARDASVKIGFFLSLPNVDPGLLENDTTYYWAVDEIDSTFTTIPGPIWSFTTIGGIAIEDPSLVAWYTFDKLDAGDDDSLIIDWSGHGNTGVAMGDLANIMQVQDSVMGSVLSLPGGSNQFIDCGSVGLSGNDATTIACFAKADHTNIPDWTLIFGFTGTADGAGGNGSHFNIGSLGGPGGIGAHVWGWEETILPDEETLEWHHYAMTYDGTTIAYYGDGMLMDTEPEDVKSNVRDLSLRADRVHIGSRVTQDSSFPGDVDDCRIYNRVLSEAEIAKLALRVFDVTSPGDMIQGVPNDGDWPDNEAPPNAIDDVVRLGGASSKYLHFNVGPDAISGIQVAPSVGLTIVTGLALTTANDDFDRDPTSYEVYGSNDSIDGPYELIAAGEIVDFSQADVWPRYTMNATPILFENDVAYAYYQVLFPTNRGANIMQIAEVELLGRRDPLTEGLVAYYNLDDTTADASGMGNDGTIEGAAAFVSPGFDGTGACMQFGGDIDRITVESFDVLGTGITLSAWINPTTFQNDARMISKSEGGSTNFHYWAMVLSGGAEDTLQFRLRTDQGNTTSHTSGGQVPAGEWSHVAATWDASDPVIREYINGAEVGSQDKAGTMVATGPGVKIGMGNQSIDALAQGPGNEIRPYDGLLDDVRVYERGFSPDQILDLIAQ